MRAFFLEHPAPPCEALLKTFYLVQLAFWLHMIPVTLVEPWRADFVEMMLHHLITSGMIASSYTLNFLKIGVAVFAEQDFADIFLPFAKMFKYARKQAIADVVFGLFALAWIPTRHGLFFVIYYTIWDIPNYVPEAQLVWAPENGHYLSRGTVWAYCIVLGAFQCLLLTWCALLLKAVYKALFVNSDGVSDDRSDSETEDPAKED